MAKVLIVGGGFGGVVAAESLARKLDREHQIVLVSRSRKFLFYPALVRLAFGRGEPDDVSFDLREAMLDRRVTFNEGEIARIGFKTFIRDRGFQNDSFMFLDHYPISSQG